MKKVSPFFLLLLTSCWLGHKEVRYSEMAAPPRVRLKGEEILVRTENSKEFPSFFIYEIIPTIDEGDKTILLKGHEGMYRDVTHEFRVSVKNIKQDSLSAYKIFWIDPDNFKTELKLEKDTAR